MDSKLRRQGKESPALFDLLATRVVRVMARVFRCAPVLLIITYAVILPRSFAEKPRVWAIDQQVGQFHLHCNSARGVDPRMIDHMRNLEPAVTEILSLPKSDKLVHVVLFESESEYRRYMQHYFPKLPKRRALFIQDRGPGMVFAHVHPDLGTDLRHECVHALLNNTCAALPLWLDEGLAEYFEVEAEERMFHPAHLKAIQTRIQSGFVPTLIELESLSEAAEMGNGQYRDSWAWVHFLLHRRPVTRKMLTDFLHDQALDKSPIPLSKNVDLQIPNWHSEFIQHFQSLLP